MSPNTQIIHHRCQYTKKGFFIKHCIRVSISGPWFCIRARLELTYRVCHGFRLTKRDNYIRFNICFQYFRFDIYFQYHLYDTSVQYHRFDLSFQYHRFDTSFQYHRFDISFQYIKFDIFFQYLRFDIYILPVS